MELLLVRHGEATPVGSKGVRSDRQRKLTPAGLEKTKRAAIALNKLDVRIDAMLASPYPRALETAKTLCEGLENRPRLRARDSLRPGGDIDTILQEIRLNAELGAIGLCCHEPTLSRLTDVLLGGSERPPLVFHTGAVAFMQVDLDQDPPAATLHWFLDSRQLDLIARPC
ncbi:MAG: phosphohistidine phosphatase SixA [Phycisphaerae bacterium]